MTDLSHLFRAHWMKRRPQPLQMTDEERINWLGEYCDRHEYVAPTANSIGHHVIICDGEKTIAPSFRDAVDMAAAKHKEQP